MNMFAKEQSKRDDIAKTLRNPDNHHFSGNEKSTNNHKNDVNEKLMPVEGDQEDEFDPVLPPPRGKKSMLYGFVGEIALEAANGKEVNEYAAFMYLLTALSANFGRDIYLAIGDSYHHSRLFCLHLGRSAKGRKGETMKLVDRILEEAQKIDIQKNHSNEIVCITHKGGLSTREGLISLIHDGINLGTKTEEPAINDKRMLVVESEFANVLHQSKRDGNTLSAAMRDLYDGRSISPLIKKNKMGATDPHIAMWANITPSELVELVSERELSNGSFNRYITIFAERYCLVSMPEATPHNKVLEYSLKCLDVIEWAKGSYPDYKNTRQAHLSDEAKQAYDRIYKFIEGRNNGNLSDILVRLSTNLLRMALTLAIVDKSLIIEVVHIEVAYEWSLFSDESVRYIFAAKNDLLQQRKIESNAAKIINFLKSNKSATRTELSINCFYKHLPASDIDSAINSLLLSTPPKIKVNVISRAVGKGKKTQNYSLSSEVSEFSEVSNINGMQPENNNCEVSEVSEVSEFDDKEVF